jgi:hypothetical protein
MLKNSKVETFSLNRIDILADKQFNWISEIINNNELKTINFERKKKQNFQLFQGVSNFNFTNLFTSLKSKFLKNLILFSNLFCEKIHLLDNNIGVEACKCLSEILLENKTIEKLNLGCKSPLKC